MNKELIKKYKTEFDHWLNEGSLLWCRARDGVKRWEVVKDSHTDFFNTNDAYYIYVINDEYVELRKAIAEGKTIQFHYINPTLGLDEWQTINDINSLTFSHSIDLYRIKPEKPQFKIGDWVETFGGPKLIKTNQDIEKFVSKKMTAEFSLWKPKPREWCWFFNKDRTPVISQFVEIEDGKYFASYPNEPNQLGSWYSHCEPFIGELPTHLKD